jgi:hypothetical protein
MRIFEFVIFIRFISVYAKFYLENPDNWKFTYRGIDGVRDAEIAILRFQQVMEFVDRYFTDYSRKVGNAK